MTRGIARVSKLVYDEIALPVTLHTCMAKAENLNKVVLPRDTHYFNQHCFVTLLGEWLLAI
jgi:hypothetical protein